jgi:hypothetical protein
MKVINFEAKKIELILFGIKEQYNFIEPIDNDYNVTFECKEHDAYSFKVTVFWNLGCSESDSDEVISGNSYFIINKNESFRKFTKEINDILDVIISKPFDSELSDDEFNQLNND